MQENEKKEPTLEENFSALELVIKNLENREISLEDSFKAYQKGMELIKCCSETIDRVEKKMLQISESGEYSEV